MVKQSSSVWCKKTCECGWHKQVVDQSTQEGIHSIGDLVVLGLCADVSWLQLTASFVSETLLGFGWTKTPST